MKPIYIKNVTILDADSEWHRRQANILIENGKISNISESDEGLNGAEVIEADGLYISSGWIDLRAGFCDPGYEYKEDIMSGLEAAAYGGFTGVAMLPDTEPVMAGKSVIEYVLRKASGNIVDLYPLAAITSDKSQEDLTEMFDAVSAGARGFSSGQKSVADSGFLLRAMEYAGMTGAPIMVKADNKSISGKGQVNEGVISVMLGLKGIPDIAEETDIHTLLKLCEYTGQPLHISCVSTKAGLQAIEEAQNKGLPVSGDISIHNLYFDEEALGMFDTSLKLKPPLRRQADRDFLRASVLKNINLSVVSDHNPHEEDKKRCEFEIAAYGATGLQTVFPQLIESLGIQNLDSIIDILTVRPAKVLRLPKETIKTGAIANLTLFDPEKKWILDAGSNFSKSKNSPFWEKPLSGKAVMIINKRQLKKLD